MKKLRICGVFVTTLVAGWLYSGGLAQAQNPQCPTRPNGDSSNACASTAFVQNAITGVGPIPGLTCDGVTDDRAVLQAAIDAAAAGDTLVLPSSANGCAVSENGSNGYTLLISKPLVFRGEGASSSACIRPLATVGATVDTIRWNASASFNYGGSGLWNICLGNPATGTRQGRHGLYLDTTVAGGNFGNMIFAGVRIYQSTGTGVAIFHDNNATNNTNGGFFTSTIRDSVLNGGVSLNLSGDSLWFVNNVIAGTGAGIYANLTAGAGNLGIDSNNCTAPAGCVVIDRAVSTTITNNEFEQLATNTQANNSIIDLRGTTATLGTAVITGNMIQDNPSTGNPTLVRIGAATGTIVDNNRFGTSTSRVAVNITASSTSAVMGAGNTCAGCSTLFTDSGTTTIYMPKSLGAASSLIGNAGGSKVQGVDIAVGNFFAFTAGPTLINQALTGDVTSPTNSTLTTLANIPSGVAMAGSLLATNIVAPGTPAAGKTSIYVDSTTKRLSSKNDAGTIAIDVVPSTCGGGQFANSISVAGVIACGTPAGSGGITIGTTSITSGTTTRILYDNAGIVGEYTITGTGTVVAMQTSPAFTTPTLGVASATSLANTGTAGAGFVEIANQSSAPSTPTSASRIFIDSTNRLSWKGTNGFVRTFDGTANSADRVYVLPDLAGTVALTANNLSVFAATTSAQLAGVLSDETGTGVAVFATAPTFTTSITVPLVIGGSGTTGTQLTIQSTTGNGTTDAIVIKRGNNGAVTAATINADGIGINTVPGTTTGLDVLPQAGGTGARVRARAADEIGTVQFTTSNISAQIGKIQFDNTPSWQFYNGVVQIFSLTNVKLSVDVGTASTSKTTGALVVTGGAGVSGATFTDTLNVITMANTATTSAVCYNTATGLVTYDGTIGTCTVSDERLKNIGNPIPNALDKLLAIHGVYYTWKEPTLDRRRQIGVSAQAVERVFPELVQTDSTGTKSADYQRLTAPIIEALRELKADNDNLRQRIGQLEKRRARK